MALILFNFQKNLKMKSIFLHYNLSDLPADKSQANISMIFKGSEYFD